MIREIRECVCRLETFLSIMSGVVEKWQWQWQCECKGVRTTRSFSQGSRRPGPCSSSRPPATASHTRRSASLGDSAPSADCITPDTSSSMACHTQPHLLAAYAYG